MAGTDVGSGYVTIYSKLAPSFQSTISSGMNTTGQKSSESFGSGFSKGMSTLSIAAGNILATGFNKVASMIGNNLGNAISRVDTLNNFPKVMANLGIGADQAQAAIDKVSQGIQGLPTTLDAAASAVQRFTSVNNDVGKSADMFLAVNDAILAGGASTEIQASALEQLSQAYSKGKMDLMEWRTLQMAMPAQLKQVADAMGITTDKLGEGLRKGSISMDDFIGKIMELDKEGVNGLASFSEQAKAATSGLATTIKNANLRITQGIAEAINSIGTENLNSIINDLGDAAKELVIALIPAAQAFANFAKQAAPVIKQLAPYLPQIAAGFLAFKGVSAVAGHIDTLSGAFGKLGGLVSKIKPAGTELAKVGQDVGGVGTSMDVAGGGVKSGASKMSEGFQKLIGMSAVIAAIGVMVAGVGVGFWLMADGAAKLGEAGDLAVIAFTIMGVGLLGLIATVAMFSGQLTGCAPALLAIGAMVLMVGAGFYIMAAAATMLANAGTGAIVCFGIMVVGLIALVVVLGIFGPALNAAVPFLLAFGAAVLMAGVGIGIAAAGIALLVFAITGLCSQLPMVAEYGMMAAAAFAMIGASLIVVGAGAAVAAAGFVVLAAALIPPIATLAALLAEFLALDVELAVAMGLLFGIAGGFVACSAGAAILAGIIGRIKGDCESACGSMWELQGSVDTVGNAIQGLQGLAEGAISGVVGWFNNLSGNASSAMNNMWNNISNAFNSGASSCISAAQNMVNTINSILSGAGNNAWDTGYNIGQGLASGMNASLGAVSAAASKMVEEAKKAAEAKAQIGSPSKLFRKAIGQMIGVGTALGITDKAKLVSNAVRDMIPEPVGGVLSNGGANLASEVSFYAENSGKGQNGTVINANFYDTQTSPDAIYQKLRTMNTQGLARSY